MITRRRKRKRCDPKQRFLSKVNQLGPIPDHCPEIGRCWEWTASKKRNGYGQFTLNYKNLHAQRASWILFRDDVPLGISVLHKCDNRACVNTDHLFLGTQKDNVRDMYAKSRNRAARGADIRDKYSSGKYSQNKLAEMYDVTQPLMGYVVRRETWSHI